jgi:UDP-N-acetylmuramate--alanine ligase
VRLGRVRRLHFAGVDGVGMCGLAEVLLAEGLVVSGCDLAPGQRSERLRGLGVEVAQGHHPSHLEGVDALVVSAALDRSNSEVSAALDRGIPVVRRAEMLGEVMRSRVGVAVAGTHGKTTTTALVGHILTSAGRDPTLLVGGRVRALESGARLGRGEVLVCEADEFDRSFLVLQPAWAVITNVEAEHLDCYRDTDDLESAFATFAGRVPFWGAVVACADDAGARRVAAAVDRRVVTYGTGAGAWLRASEAVADPRGTRFAVAAGGRSLGTMRVALPGEHNLRNALAAVAVGLELEVEPATIAAALESFSGVSRRFELVGERRGVMVVDDYAHHPTEIRATLAAARQAFPGRRLVALFQPHLYSRTRDFAEDFATALLGAEVAVVLPIYPAREKALPGVTAELVVGGAVRRGHPSVFACGGVESAPELLDRILVPGDVLLTLGAGDVDRAGAAWLGGGR